MFRTALALTALSLTALLGLALPSSAQTAQATPTASVAAEADVLAYGLSGYSGIFSVTLPSKRQVAFGVGRYDPPSFLLSGDVNYDQAQWEATVTSIQVARATYRFRGAMKSGPRSSSSRKPRKSITNEVARVASRITSWRPERRPNSG